MVYLSGPMTGLSVEEYTARFNEAEDLLSLRGFIVINPARVLAQLPEGISYEGFLNIDYAMLDVCDSIYMLKGWQKSRGANLERKYAMEHGKQVLYCDGENGS